MAGLGTVQEVKYKWDIDTLLDAHEALDIKEEAQAWAQRKG